MTYEEYKLYLHHHYPRLHPCMECFYWRGQSGGREQSPLLPMCHYMLLTEESRDCFPDFEKRKCDKFKPKKKKK